MTDLWTIAGDQAESDDFRRRAVTAKEAVSDVLAFIASAGSREDFANRRELMASQIARAASDAAEGDAAMAKAIIAELDEDSEDEFELAEENAVEARRKRAVSVASEVSMCVDCLMFVANGELPENNPTFLEDFERINEGYHVAPGDGDEGFSMSSCDTCGSSLGGDRFQGFLMEARKTASNEWLYDMMNNLYHLTVDGVELTAEIWPDRSAESKTYNWIVHNRSGQGGAGTASSLDEAKAAVDGVLSQTTSKRAMRDWGEGLIGKQILGMPGSVITEVTATADYLINGPVGDGWYDSTEGRYVTTDFLVSVKLADGREIQLPKSYQWLEKNRTSSEKTVSKKQASDETLFDLEDDSVSGPLDNNTSYAVRNEKRQVVFTNVYGGEAQDILDNNPGWTAEPMMGQSPDKYLSNKTAEFSPWDFLFNSPNTQPAFEAGEAAFAAGEARRPPPPPAGMEVGGGYAEVAEAWLAGWDSANMAVCAFCGEHADGGTGICAQCANGSPALTRGGKKTSSKTAAGLWGDRTLDEALEPYDTDDDEDIDGLTDDESAALRERFVRRDSGGEVMGNKTADGRYDRNPNAVFVDSLLLPDLAPIGIQPGFENQTYKAYKYQGGEPRNWAVVTDPDDLDNGWMMDGVSMKEAFESANAFNAEPWRAPDHSQFHDDTFFGLANKEASGEFPCNCENSGCHAGTHFVPGPASEADELFTQCPNDGTIACQYIGQICASCAEFMPESYLLRDVKVSKIASTRYEVAQRVIQNSQAEQLEGHLLDLQTAQVLVAVYEALSPENQEAFDTPDLMKLVEMGWRNVARKLARR